MGKFCNGVKTYLADAKRHQDQAQYRHKRTGEARVKIGPSHCHFGGVNVPHWTIDCETCHVIAKPLLSVSLTSHFRYFPRTISSYRGNRSNISTLQGGHAVSFPVQAKTGQGRRADVWTRGYSEIMDLVDIVDSKTRCLVQENWKRMLYWRNNDCSSWAAPRDAQVFGVFGGDRSWRSGHSLFIRCCMRSTHSCLRIRRWATYVSHNSCTRAALCTRTRCLPRNPPYRRGWAIRERSSKRSSNFWN